MDPLAPRAHWLADFVRKVNHAASYQDLVELARDAAETELGLTNAWIYVRASSDDDHFTLKAASGSRAAMVREHLGRLPITGDPHMEALCRGEGPFLIDDVRELPGVNREVVDFLGNRALCNAPLADVNASFGALGAGTFGDEGPRSFDAASVDRYMQVVALISAGMARIRLREHHEHEEATRRKLAEHQRLENLGLLAGGVAHDLNNLLTVVSASLELVEQAGLSPAQHADVALGQAAVDSAVELGRQLMALGRRRPVHQQSSDAVEATRATGTLLRRVLPATIGLELELADEPLWISMPQGDLEQVLLNLALNARDAMPDGGTLRMRAERVERDEAGTSLRISVTDTGIGMTAEVQEQIYVPFFTTKAVGHGTGLGLAVSYGLLRQHDGYLHCASELGRGTTFSIDLPLVETTATPPDPALEGPPPRGSERVLLVEDDEQLRNVTARVLRNAGYQVVCACDGLDAVAHFDEGPFELHIVDAVMPRMDGRATIEALRTRWPHGKVLVASGYAADALPAAFLADLDVSMLPKPFAPAALLRRVRTLIDAPPPTDRAGRGTTAPPRGDR